MRDWKGSKWIRREKRLAIYQRDHFTCQFCGQHMLNHNVMLSLDHVIPVSAGGTNEASNLITSCVSCNSKKGDQPIESFVTIGKLNIIRNQTGKKLNIKQAKSFINVLGYGNALIALSTIKD